MLLPEPMLIPRGASSRLAAASSPIVGLTNDGPVARSEVWSAGYHLEPSQGSTRNTSKKVVLFAWKIRVY